MVEMVGMVLEMLDMLRRWGYIRYSPEYPDCPPLHYYLLDLGFLDFPPLHYYLRDPLDPPDP
jgi:hypothetical protein